ncbi:MAG: gamma-glutamylcyclotransferase [Candidatus Rokubacteria bacterium]|nr:gamma-glutamylcyclotransferase [Candidatus Rokubacteria bacterium]
MWYFAYGSNMCAERLIQRVGKPKKVATGQLHGFRLVFNKLGDDCTDKGNVVSCEGEAVLGVLYDLTRKQLADLDRYEGYPSHYERKKMPIEVGDAEGKMVEAWVYLARPSKIREGLKPTAKYVEFYIRGAKEHGLPEAFVKWLMTVETTAGEKGA